jgi:hypothetical protein
MFRELELSYDGTQYRIKPTMDLIRALETAGFSPFDLARRVHRGDQCFAVYSSFLGEILRYAGARVTDDQIYATLTSGQGMADLVTQVGQIVSAILPPSPVPVDSVGPAVDAGKPKRARRLASGSPRLRSS